MNHLDFILDTKAVTEDGQIEGLAAGYGNVDAGGDVIVPGALARSLRGRTSVPMLMYHDQTRPAGIWTDFAESRDGLVVKGQLSLSSQIGQEAHALVRDGAIGGLSIGYKTIREQIVGKTRQLLELALYEVSLVTIPMNERAVRAEDLQDASLAFRKRPARSSSSSPRMRFRASRCTQLEEEAAFQCRALGSLRLPPLSNEAC